MKKLYIAIVLFTLALYTTGCDKVIKTETEASEKSEEMAKSVVVASDSAASKTAHFFKRLFTRKKLKTAEVSKETQSSVHQLYPDMEIVEWESAPEYIVESGNDTTEIFEVVHPEIYIVTLKKDNELTKAKFHQKGQLIESRKILAAEKVPQPIQEALSHGAYRDWEIVSEREEIKKAAEQELLYRLVVEKDNHKKILYFNKDGKLAKILNPV